MSQRYVELNTQTVGKKEAELLDEILGPGEEADFYVWATSAETTELGDPTGYHPIGIVSPQWVCLPMDLDALRAAIDWYIDHGEPSYRLHFHLGRGWMGGFTVAEGLAHYEDDRESHMFEALERARDGRKYDY